MIPFSDLPDNERFRLRSAIEEHGGNVEMYDGDDVQVAMPNPWRPFVETMEQLGLSFVTNSGTYWPLCSDHYPDHQRHSTRQYPNGKGFWMSGRFNVPDFCLI